jgi:hypothetical protein
MVTSYGNFPGVRVEVAGGGITSVAIGEEEKLVLFGEAAYQTDDPVFNTKSDGEVDGLESGLLGSVNEPVQINARREADTNFGDGSELADGMREALANGANTDYLYGVAPQRFNVIDEVQSTQAGALDNAPVYEEDVSDESNISALQVVDSDAPGVQLDVRYSYESDLTVPGDAPSDDVSGTEAVVVNPLTGEYIADQSPVGDLQFTYKYLDWQSAFEARDVARIIEEEETGVYVPLSDSDAVSVDANGAAQARRQDFQLVNVVTGALPNANERVEDSNGNYVRRDARFDTSSFTQGSVDSDYLFKLAPVRVDNSSETILGGVGGLFAGNPISDPIYNDALNGYGDLEQQFTKSDADNMRAENVIPVRQGGSVRVKDNLSTSTETDWERDFWRRRIADRVILIGKTVGDSVIGRINDESTRDAAERLIRTELRQLVADRLLKPNTEEEQNYFVDVYEDSSNANQVNIDIGFTPFGIVKRIDETVTINT